MSWHSGNDSPVRWERYLEEVSLQGGRFDLARWNKFPCAVEELVWHVGRMGMSVRRRRHELALKYDGEAQELTDEQVEDEVSETEE